MRLPGSPHVGGKRNPTGYRARVLAIPLVVLLATRAECATAGDLDFSGVWEIRHTYTQLGQSVMFPKDWTDHKAIEIEQDPKSGHVSMSAPNFTPEMQGLGYQAWNTVRFDGELDGGAAVGTEGSLRAPFWQRTDCPPSPARLRLIGEQEIEFSEAAYLREECQWSDGQHLVWNLAPVYIVREVYFIDQPEDGSPPKPIKTAAPDQKFRIVVEFKVAPPATVYVAFANRPVVVHSTQAPDLFQSDQMTLNEFQGDR